MRIWLINPYGPIPGESWRDYRFTIIGETLAAHGHQVRWWTANFSHHFKCFRSKGWNDLDVRPNFQIRLVPTLGYRKHIGLGRVRFELLFAWRMYRRAMKEPSPACIIAVDPPQTIGFLAVRLARRFGIPLILDVMDLWPEIFVLAFPRWLRPLAPVVLCPLYALRRHNLRQASAVTALCNTYLEMALKEAPRLEHAPSATIFNGVNVGAFRAMNQTSSGVSELAQKIGKRPGEVWVIYAGTLGNNYDIDTLLQAAVQLQQRRSRIKIVLVGDGPLRQRITEFIEVHRLSNLIYLGKFDVEDLIRLYQVCDVGLCAYAPESNVAMPDKAYDYMAAGLPIVNSLRGELENFLRDRQMGLQYIAGDARSLCNALEELASDADRRRTMARNSYNTAMMFDGQTQYRKFLEVLQQVVGQ